MSKARMKNSSSKTRVPSDGAAAAQIHPITGRIIDPRVVAWGKAEMAMFVARNDLSVALQNLGIDPEPIIDILAAAHQKTDDAIDRAMAQRGGRRAA